MLTYINHAGGMGLLFSRPALQPCVQPRAGFSVVVPQRTYQVCGAGVPAHQGGGGRTVAELAVWLERWILLGGLLGMGSGAGMGVLYGFSVVGVPRVLIHDINVHSRWQAAASARC